GIGCNDRAFEESMGVPLQDVAVLEGPGLALVSVDHEILWFSRFLGNKGPLPTGGKASTAKTTQLSFINLVGHLLLGHDGESFSGCEISTLSDVIFEPRPVWILEPRREHGPV